MTSTVEAPSLDARDAPLRRRGALPDRWWFVIVFVIALAVFLATDTGRMIFDTKLEVDLNAREFLDRLWPLWNPLEWFGSLQDQYIGYAIPMAPFFAVLQLAHIPIWVIERLWLSLLVAVGFTGMVKLARALGVGSDSSRLVAGAVFALWPTFTVVIGSTSAAALPGLMAPWAVLPLVSAAAGRTTAGRAAARSGLAIALMGGVNAYSTLAVLVLPALYILTHTRARQRVELALKWAVAVLAATAWWLIPLLLQARYSFDFLPYIEQATTTSATMSAAAVLRGTGTWTAYLNFSGTPWLSAGWAMVTSPAAILASAAAAATGLAGLARRDMPERRWLCICVGLVAAVALAGYFGPFGGPLHSAVDSLLNGPLAPFRSMYKLEPVIAVALALGCAHVLSRWWRLSFQIGRGTRIAASAAGAPVLALALAGLALPQLTGQALQPGSFTSVPAYWDQASAYLAAHSPRQTALVVPADPHGQFTWGDTIDDPLEPLATSPWVERGLVPYGGAGSQDLLETAEQAVESGQQVPGLAGYLARAGIRYVVVRNDADPSEVGYTAPQVVNETLALSGFQRVASFGPQVAAAPGYPDIAGLVPGLQPSYPAVEIFQAADPTDRPTGPATALPVADTALVNGGSDSLLQLEGQQTLGSRPAVIAGDRLQGKPALWAITDGQRRADNDFGTTDAYQSFTYTATETNPIDDPLGDGGGQPRQLLPVPAAGHQTVAVLRGAGSVTASSSGSWLNEAPQYAPVNAFDGNPATAWTESNPQTPVGQWVQVNFNHALDLPDSVGIQLLDNSYTQEIANQLRVTTAAGSVTTDTVSTGSIQRLRTPPGPTSWLRITITGADNVVAGSLGAGISDVLIPGVRVATYLQPAQDAAGAKAPAVDYSFSQPANSPYGQLSQPGQASAQPLDRTFVTTAAGSFTTQITAVPEPGSGLASLLSRLSPATRSQFKVTASSTWDGLPELGPDNLFQSSSRLPWLAGAGDPRPELEVSWNGKRTIREIVLKPAYGIAAAPTGVLVGSPAGYRLVKVGRDGVVRLNPPLRTNRLYLLFPAASSSAAGNTLAGQPAQLPAGLAKVTIPALAGLHVSQPSDSTRFTLACGQGPDVTIDGHRYPTSVSGTIGDLVNLTPVRLTLCTPGGAVRLSAGRQWLAASPTSKFAITSLSLQSSRVGTAGAARPDFAGTSRQLQVVSWQADSRELRVGPGQASYVEIHENVNPGWTATMNGKPLTPVTLDGWQQGFIVPAGHGGTVSLSFQPAGVYHDGIIASALALLAVLAVALGLRRPLRKVAAAPGDPARVQRTALADFSAAMERRLSVVRPIVMLLPLAAVLFLAGGPVAVAVPILGVIGHWRPRLLPAIAAVAMLAAGVVAAAASTPAQLGSGPFSAPAQICALIALAAALLPVISRSPGKTALHGQPFTVTDELTCYFDTPDEPANVHLEVGLSGKLDPATFRAAALAALAAGPRTCSRRARGHWLRRRFYWERTSGLERDPVAFATWSDRADLDRQRTAFIARSPSLECSPPVSVLLASGPDGDHVVLNAHHAALDGLSCLELLRDIARRYRNAPVPAGDGTAANRTPTPPATPAGPVPPRSALAALRRPARVAGEGGGQSGCEVLMLSLPEVPPVPALGDGERATLNDVFVAALMMTVDRWNTDHGRPRRQVRVTVPLNARQPGQAGATGNHSRIVPIAADPPALDDRLGLLRDVARQVRHARLNPSAPVDGGSRAIAALWCPTPVKRGLVRAALRIAGPLVCDTVMLTNLGNVTDPPDFGLPGAVTLAISGPAHMPRGLSVGVATVAGQLRLGVRYNRALLDAAAVTEFCDRYVATLTALAGAGDADRL